MGNHAFLELSNSKETPSLPNHETRGQRACENVNVSFYVQSDSWIMRPWILLILSPHWKFHAKKD